MTLLVKDGVAPVFTPDGKKVAFVSRINASRIYLIDADGSNPMLMTDRGFGGALSGGVMQALSFSPDGSRMAFVCAAPLRYQWDICLLDVRSRSAKRLTENPPRTGPVFSPDGHPAFSPDGRKIAFVRDFRVYVMNADGTNVAPLTNGLCPTFSPDGRQIAFVCPPGQICIMNADGTGVTRLPVSGGSPSWR